MGNYCNNYFAILFIIITENNIAVLFSQNVAVLLFILVGWLVGRLTSPFTFVLLTTLPRTDVLTCDKCITFWQSSWWYSSGREQILWICLLWTMTNMICVTEWATMISIYLLICYKQRKTHLQTKLRNNICSMNAISTTYYFSCRLYLW